MIHARDLLAFVRESGAALARSWPALVALFVLAMAWRQGIMWVALWVSRFNADAAIFILPFAPAGVLAATFFMLRAAARDTPLEDRLRLGGGSRLARARRWTLAALPFLAVYQSLGLVTEDERWYLINVMADVGRDQTDPFNFVRLDGASVLVAAIAFGAALAVQALVGWKFSGSAGWQALGTYAAALAITSGRYALAPGREWLHSRAVWQWASDAWQQVLQSPAGGAATSVWSVAELAWSAVGPFLVVPLAWLALSLSTFGSRLESVRPQPFLQRMLHPFGEGAQANKVWQKIAGGIFAPLQGFWAALQTAKTYGWGRIIGLCLVLGLLPSLQTPIAHGMRALVGPQDRDWLDSWLPVILNLGLIVPYVLLVCVLVGATVTILGPGGAASTPAAAPPQTPSTPASLAPTPTPPQTPAAPASLAPAPASLSPGAEGTASLTQTPTPAGEPVPPTRATPLPPGFGPPPPPPATPPASAPAN